MTSILLPQRAAISRSRRQFVLGLAAGGVLSGLGMHLLHLGHQDKGLPYWRGPAST